jgi:hypothetical protein
MLFCLPDLDVRLSRSWMSVHSIKVKVLLNPKNLSAQHRASPNANSTTANNIAHHRTPTLQLQATSRIAELQLNNCNQHRASLNANSTTAINIAHR